jgi:O-antigen biosynthesis protein
MISASKRVLVINSRPPTPDYDSASLRLHYMLRALRELGCQITFAASYPDAWPPLTDRVEDDIRSLQEANIEVVRGPAVSAVDDWLQTAGRTYDAVILSGGVYIARRHIGSALKYAPQAIIIFDTVDLTFLREYRHAKLTGNVPQLRRALACKQIELSLVKQASYTLVVSEAEKKILEREYPEAHVRILSTIHEITDGGPAFGERRDILFIGTFQHLPNVDAMRYFISDVWPLIRQELGDAKFLVIGGEPPDEIKALAADDVIVTGHVPDLAPYLNRCKLSVAPLRFGAGVKGKVLTSMSYSVPVVVSSVAAEGMPLADGRDVLIADSPQGFCQAVVNLYSDESLWNRLSQASREIIKQHFSFAAARDTLGQLLADEAEVTGVAI